MGGYIYSWAIFATSMATVMSRKNVLLFVFDDLRPSLGCYGDTSSFSPNIDRLARDGILFSNAYAQQALCGPSRNSFLTSRRPDALHLYDVYSYWRTFAGNFTTLPQYFKEHGYRTKSVGKVFHPGISSNYSDDQPYSWTEAPFHPTTEVLKNAAVCYSQDDPFVPHMNVVCPVRVTSQPGRTLPDMESAEEAITFLRGARTSTTPFFLAVGFHKPHIPLKYPKHFNRYHKIDKIKLPENRTRPPKLPDVAWNPWMDLRKRHDIQKLNLTFPYDPIPDDVAKLIYHSYYAAITYVDSLFGRVIRQLHVEDLYNDAIIVVMADHGWSLGEHGEWSKFSNYEVATRVPFIIKPSSTQTNSLGPQIITDIVELVDLMPTLAFLAGLPNVPVCVGRTETKLCTQGKNAFQKQKIQEAFSQYPRPGKHPQENSDEPKLKDIKFMGYSIRTPRYRYTEWVKFRHRVPQWSSLVGTELYDHEIDPGENLNVANLEKYKEAQMYLRSRLHNQGNRVEEYQT